MAKMVFAIEQTAKNLITGTDKIVISSGKNFLQDWEKFKKEIGKKLEEINPDYKFEFLDGYQEKDILVAYI